MIGLLKRLQKIQDECTDKNKNDAHAEDENVDEFTRLKKKVAREVKEIRHLIQERDQLEKDAPGSVATVEVSHNIRSKMKDVRLDAASLDKLQKEEKEAYIRKNKTAPALEEQIEKREEVVGLVFDHIEECKQLDQRRNSGLSYTNTRNTDPVVTELPDIDDAGFQMLRKNDAIIDDMLDNTIVGVHDLRDMAIEMGKEAEKQGVMMDNLDVKVDKVNIELENINIRLKKALDSVRKGDRFIVDIILLCILLGLGGYIYSIIK